LGFGAFFTEGGAGMSNFEKFDAIMSRLIGIAVIGFGFGVIGWGVIIGMLWIHKVVLS
jgi:hypothetical protein